VVKFGFKALKEEFDAQAGSRMPGISDKAGVKMKVRMLVEKAGSPDGFTVVNYRQGEAYDLPLSLAEPWLARGLCEQDKMVMPSEVKEKTNDADPKDAPSRRTRKPRRS